MVNIKKVLLHHDNAKPHTARTMLQKISEFNWELLPHPAYSPDIAPDVQNELSSFFFASKPESSYSNGIKKLPVRWREIVDSGGKYIID
ncbi:Histone-lysine N-methyltransferase SETMAR [Anthophora plagiata]